MSGKEGPLLPTFHQKPIPFIKVLRKHFPLFLISLLLTLSLLCYVFVFETVIRFMGGLLSAFALTNDQMFLQKAKHVADRMLPAFETTTGEHSIKLDQKVT